MSPAAHALDRLLFDLRGAHEALATDLAGLEGEGTYAVLAAGTLISGVTAARVQPALVRVADVRLGLDLLGGLIADVSQLRGTDEARATELFAHLNSPCIVLPGSTVRAVAPQDLLTAMAGSLAPMRVVVGEVDTVWREFVPHLDRVTAEAEQLAETLPTSCSVTSARSVLATLAGRVIHDPLGAADELTRVEATLAEAAATGAKVPGLQAGLAAAADTIEELESLIAAGRAALARSRAEISDPEALLDPVDTAIVTGERGLSPWLTRLERLVAGGDVGLAETGLASWQALADKTLTTAREVATTNARPTERRQELRSLLRAARVKAGASGLAEDLHLTKLAKAAEDAFAVPCDLSAAEARVAEYVDELRRTPTPAQSRRPGREEISS